MRDPVKEFFSEKLQMIFSSNHTNAILKKTQEGKRVSTDKIESIQSLVERKELRAKKFDFDTKVQTDDMKDKERDIKNLLDKHERIDSKIIDHYKKETSQQEDIFQKKMRERKDRSVERSLSRSVDVGSRRNVNKKMYEGDDKGGVLKAGAGQAPMEVTGSVLNKQMSLAERPRPKLDESSGVLQKSKEDIPPKESEILKSETVIETPSNPSEVPPEKLDAFSYKKMSALSAKLSKMKMFNQEFEQLKEKET